uniref:Prolyl endopeptidase n=1 Tax=Conocybe apala TaxID=229365 RepID=C4P9M4_9AGAR|nr:prolyl oligopeptidase [Conocybe apala]
MPPSTPNEYPPTRRSDDVLTYRSEKNGEVVVPDPYQWLEHNTEETDKWTTAQAAFTRAHLDKNPKRNALEEAFTAANDYAKFSAPQLHDDGRWYWYYNTGLQAQTCLWRTRDDTIPDFSKQLDEDVGEIFFDPNALSKDGTAALSTYRFSRDGKYFAYAIAQSGSDFNTIYVRPTDSPLTKRDESGRDPSRLADEVKFVKFSGITWAPNSEGFFYQRYPHIDGATLEEGGIATRRDLHAMVYYHRVGTPQSEDILIHRDPANPEWMFGVNVTDNGEYIELYISKDSSRKNMLWVANFAMNKIGEQFQWRKVINDFAAEYDVITNHGPVYYFRTDDGAPKHKILSINIDTNERKLLVPESEDAALFSTVCVNKNYMALIYKRNVKDEVHLYTLEGKPVRRLAEDFVGACTISGKEKQPWFFVTMSGFTSPSTVGRYNFQIPEEENRWSIFRAAKIKNLNPNDFEASQVWYKSKDGTNVPMFIVRHKSTQFDGTAPALQYGYGGFSISIDPFFSASILTFLKVYGAILVVPSIRGGNEFGEEWHRGGMKQNKVNCFDDFIAATNHLVEHKYAAPGKVAINGGSNGGLLVAACINRAPEGTFGAAIAEVGVHDMLKFHKFTIGKAWTSDYGNPDDPHDFDYIYPISPVHNVPTDKILPPTLLLTADHDDRVVPMHTFKLAATLQHTLPHNPHPLLLRVDKKAGHGAGKPLQLKIREQADKWGFVAQSFQLVWRDGV